MTTARQIVTRALKEAIMSEGESPSAEAITDGLEALNGLLASWHNDGLLIFYPTGKTWVGDWKLGTVYAVDEAVAVGGGTYYCSVGHTSTANDLPGSSPNFSSYWTLYAETPMTLASTFPLDARHERGVVAMLAIEIAPMFGTTPSALTMMKAKDGMNGIYGQYFKVPNASVDPGITRMPSQIWPYST